MAKVELKRPVVEEIAANVKGAESVVLVSYSGINVDADTKLRKDLREAGVVYKVYKNTMMNFAFKGTEFEPLCEHLNGPNAIAICKEDATAAARVISKYAKIAPTVKMIAGVVEGKFCDEKAVAALADIPSRDVLLGRLFGSMQSPIANFARIVKQIMEKDGEAPAAEAPAEEPAASAE
ncbi:MAG: 50S ribosomal protein L10 [Lachnospiraceae bacterium]|nr:50S ribosomal protein L10 [Lachnospiraceae bacterium]